MTMDIGPFRFYRVPETNTLCVSLIALDNYSVGWEYGYDDPLRGPTTPWVNFRIGKLNVFYFEGWKWGFELWFMGFWVIL